MPLLATELTQADCPPPLDMPRPREVGWRALCRLALAAKHAGKQTGHRVVAECAPAEAMHLHVAHGRGF